MASRSQTKKVLIVVRTYPTPSKSGVEVSCTAGITEQGEWMRLFPVPYRFLAEDKRFRKYQWIEVEVTKASDQRPESYRLNADSIRILSEPLSTEQAWQLRKDIVFPLMSSNLCYLQRQRAEHGYPTLGIFKPKKIERLLLESETPDWNETQLAYLRQGVMFADAPKAELEKIPWRFSYEFSCSDAACKGHTMTCTDWEMGQSYRKWRDEYEDGWEQAFRQRYEADMMEKFDTHFFVGTMRGHPGSWIVVGLFYPPRVQQTSLFA